MKDDILIKLNSDFHQDCIFDFAELECKINRYNKYVQQHFSIDEICDGKPYDYIDYDDLEYHELSELENLYSSYIAGKDYFRLESTRMERDEIDIRRIDELERFDYYLESLNMDLIEFHKYRLNKIFDYIEQNY